MGLIANVNVFALMIAPIVVLCKGHNIFFSKLIPLLLIVMGVVFCRLLLQSALDIPPLTVFLRALIIPSLTEIALIHYVLNDARAKRCLGLGSCVDTSSSLSTASGASSANQGTESSKGASTDASSESGLKRELTAAVGCVFAVAQVALSSWGPWYREMASLGSEPAHFVAALGTFLLLISVILQGRVLWHASLPACLVTLSVVHAGSSIAASAVTHVIAAAASGSFEATNATRMKEVSEEAMYRGILVAALVVVGGMIPKKAKSE